MSQINSPVPSEENNSLKMQGAIGLSIILLLAGVIAYLFFDRKKLIHDNEMVLQQKQRVIDSVKVNRVYLQADFNAASATIDQLLSKNLVLKDSVQNEKVAIAGLQKRIKGILDNQKATQAELMEARSMIYLLSIKTQAYELYMAELERDNTILTGENKLLSEERDNTVETNIALKMAGSVLHASNIRMEFINEHRKGKETETAKAKKTDKIRIAFDIDENRIAESGTKQIYIRITGPDGYALYSKGISGRMRTIKGDEIKYSALKEIDFVKNQSSENIITEWLQYDNYLKGNYKIELYNQGYKIGEGSAQLR